MLADGPVRSVQVTLDIMIPHPSFLRYERLTNYYDQTLDKIYPVLSSMVFCKRYQSRHYSSYRLSESKVDFCVVYNGISMEVDFGEPALPSPISDYMLILYSLLGPLGPEQAAGPEAILDLRGSEVLQIVPHIFIKL